MDIVYLIAGLVLILVGANALTDGATSVAARLKVSPIVIGLTVVAFGTSMPEFTVSLTSALKGSSDIAIGNVVGSNIFNTLMIVGVTSLFVPIAVSKGTLRYEIPMALLSSVVLLFCAADMMISGEARNVVSRGDGLVLLCFFLIFMSYTFAVARNGDAGEAEEVNVMPMWRSLLYILAGLAGLVFGGNLFVDGASGIARSFGVSESVIGLTLVAGGTSLPELATSVVAAMKKNPEIAIGNVIGSNLFNVFFVLGASAAITPMNVAGITDFDFIVLVLSSLLLLLFAKFYRVRTVTRLEGALLVLCYVGYTAWLIYNV